MYEIVEVGELDPEMVVTPAIYVDRIVKIPEEDASSAKRRQEVFANFAKELVVMSIASAAPERGQE